MKIIISPTKKMRVETDSLSWRDLPLFLDKTEQIYKVLQSTPADELQKIWKCNDKIAALNVDRIQNMNLYHGLTPAVLAYEGIQFQYMAPGVFTEAEFDYIQEHLRILSGFYGVLRPFDGVTPYRLEMQAKISVDGRKDLYDFWGTALAESLQTDCILNLASKEYSQAVSKHLDKSVKWVNFVFGEIKNGKVVEKGTLCKMARGEMVRYLAEKQIEDIEEVKGFDRLDFRYSEEYAKEDTFVFIRNEKT